MAVINWLAKVANDPIRQGVGPDNVVGVGRNEDRWNRVARIDEVSVEFVSVIPGILTSAIKAAVSPRRGDARKSAADAKPSTL